MAKESQETVLLAGLNDDDACVCVCDDRIGKKLTVTKHCWLFVYTILTLIYMLYHRYWAFIIYEYCKLYINSVLHPVLLHLLYMSISADEITISP